MRFAGYIRVSKEEGGFSLDSQRSLIMRWVKSQRGTLTKIYADESLSGRTMARAKLQQMIKDAASGSFDAVVVAKFDRLNRSRIDALAIKSLLRYDFSVKVFSLNEPSEDSDGEEGAFIEGLMECVAEWYVQNLGDDMAKSKHERSAQGYHNTRAPFGLKKDADGILIPNESELPGLIMAYNAYATGKYSDAEIAQLLNENGYRTIDGNLFSKDSTREILQNRLYIGLIKYQNRGQNNEYKRSRVENITWYPGQHQPVISTTLFEKCQQIRSTRASHHLDTSKRQDFLLRDLVYCHRCSMNPPQDEKVSNWGKMISQSGGDYMYYRCKAGNFGIRCDQSLVLREFIHRQFTDFFFAHKPPLEWQAFAAHILAYHLNNQHLETRLDEIRAIIENIGFEWHRGFIIDKDTYLQKRQQLREAVMTTTPQITQSEPSDNFTLMFMREWRRCEDNPTAKNELLKLIVERVYVRGKRIIKIAFVGGYEVEL